MTYLAAAPDLTNISIANAGIVALLGYAVVFFGLILLMLVVMAMGKVFIAQEKKGSTDVASLFASIEKTAQKNLDKLLQDFEELAQN